MSTLNLITGRTISLRELRQFDFYEGLLLGLPTKEMNHNHLESLLGEERKRFHWCNVHLIPPTEKLLDCPADRPESSGIPAELPRVACVARFSSFQVARDESRDYSELVLIWFQDEFSFLDDTRVLDQLSKVDWEKHATDFYY